MARASLVLLAAFGLFALFGAWTGSAGPFIPWDKAGRFMAFYGLTMFSFLSFPKTRRSDIAQLVMLLAVATEVGRATLRHDADIMHLMADLAGVAVVYLTSHAEQLRRRSRETPHGPALVAGRRSSDKRRGGGPVKSFREHAAANPTPTDATFVIVHQGEANEPGV